MRELFFSFCFIAIICLAGMVDCFAAQCDESNPCDIYAEDGTYLGNTGNRYDANSINNPYGKYGSKYSDNSVNNPYGTYGSEYSAQSPNNPYNTNKQPRVYDQNKNFIGTMQRKREPSSNYEWGR